MTRIALLASVALAAACLAAPAQAHTYVSAGGNAEACYDAALNNANTADAVAICSTALSMDDLSARDRAATLTNRGILQLRLGAFESAMGDFDRAIDTDPTLAEGYINRGAALLRREDYRGAIEAISAGLERTPEDPAQAYYNRGVAHEETGNVRAAYNDYRRAAELSPSWNAPRLELTRFQVRR